MNYYPAHINVTKDGEIKTQYVEEHCRGSAECAQRKALPQMTELVFLSALIHDMGKFTAAFRNYIEAAARGEAVRRGSVNHTLDNFHVFPPIRIFPFLLAFYRTVPRIVFA